MGLATAPASLDAPSSSVPVRSTLTRLRWYILVPAAYVVLSAIVLWPLVASVRTAVADTVGDPLLNAWTLRWVQHALITDPAHLYNGNMFAPNSLSLAFSELLLPQAIMAWPVWLVSHDPLVAYNVTLLATYPLCAIALYALCRSLGANRGAAFIGGLCFAFAPLRLDDNAHLQTLSMEWMPLAILAVIRYVQRPSAWRFVAVVGTVALAALSSVYYTMMFGTGLAIFLLVESIRQRRVLISRVGVGLLVALAIAGIIVASLDLPYLIMRHEYQVTRTLDEAYDDSAHQSSYLTVPSGNVVWRRILPTSGSERAALFPGAVALLLSLAGLSRFRNPWMAGMLAFGIGSLILSFGPTLGAKGAGFPLPYRLLYEHVIGYQGIRGPARFAALVQIALSAFAALGATWLWERASRHRHVITRYATVCATVIAALVIADDATRELPPVRVSQSDATLAPYRWLAERRDTGIIAEFPVGQTELQSAFYSTYHWHPILWGHSGFTPMATYQLRGGRFAGRDDFPGPDDVESLADMGVQTLIIHRSYYPPDVLRSFSQRLVDTPSNVRFIASVGDCDIYALFPDPSSPPLSAHVSFNSNPAGNFDILPGEVRIDNPGVNARMLYTHGTLDLSVEIRDKTGKIVSRQHENVVIPALIPPGSTTIPLSVDLPHAPGNYTVMLYCAAVPLLNDQPMTAINVIGATTLPHLSIDHLLVTSPELYSPGEAVAMWVTTKGGKTFPLPNTTALDDRTIRVVIPPLPPDTLLVVAHGKSSGVELWVAPP